ncbi:TIR domain-containing protein [Streptantibioticus rubrisoli]|uniref:TIR domain-containing protein n=1 Tax=Streptantibioticus rubrisoli TaxID=1387313 RepID=A0ABT1PD85_9ACTN|nr:TIR domain-containing protein [Streptantibioticus rubrisoli]MCQ4043324.1 TIR domain-containing protein [Streptantibioticus rubrisoli]
MKDPAARSEEAVKSEPDTEQHYDAFISYSHSWDNAVAAAFQSELQSMARPWYRWRTLRIFRDVTNLSASPGLWPDIERALAQARWLIVMASPQAARSVWVRKEIQWWLEHRSADKILIAWTDGRLAWDEELGTFDWESTDALPEKELSGAFGHQPRWVDLRWLHAPEQVDRADPRMVECVADFAAPIRGMSKEELIGEHVRQRRRTMRWVRGTVAALTVLLLAAVTGGVTALVQRGAAVHRELQASSRQLVASAQEVEDTQPGLAKQLLVEAYRLDPSGQAMGALLGSAAIPRVIATGGVPVGAAFSPHRDLLAAAVGRGVTLYDSTDSRVLARLTAPRGVAPGLAFSPDDRLLAVGDRAGDLRLYDVTSAARPTLLVSANTGGSSVRCLAFTPDSRSLVVGLDDALAEVFDVSHPRTPRRIAVFAQSAQSVDGLSISPDGRLLAMGGERDSVGLWDLSEPRRPAIVARLTGSPDALAFSPDGHLLAVGGQDDAVRLWDVTDPAHARQDASISGQPLSVCSLAFSHDGATLAVGSSGGDIQLWSASDPLHPAPGARLTGHTSPIAQLAFSRDDRTLASASTDGTPSAPDGGDNGSVRLWNVDGPSLSSAQTALASVASSVPAFSRTGDILATGFPTTLWDTSGQRPRSLTTLGMFGQGGQAVSFSPDGGTIATGSPVVMWDVRDPAHPHDLTPGNQVSAYAASVVFNPAGSLLAVGGTSVQLWDVRDRHRPTRLATLKDATSRGQDVAFRRDGRILATRDHAGAVQLWDVGSAAEPVLRASFKPARSMVTALAFSSDGRTLITGSTGGTVATWDVREVDHPRQLAAPTGHVGEVGGIAYDPRAPLAASGGADGSMLLWDMSDPTHPAVLAKLAAGDSYVAASLAFSPNGAELAAAGASKVQIWDIRTADILQRLCAQSPVISPDQWRQYLPQMAYDPPCAR